MTGQGWTVDAWRDFGRQCVPTLKCSFRGADNGSVATLSSDTRTLHQPERTVFFALRGPWHDGHDHLLEAHQKGVRRFVVAESIHADAPWAGNSDVLVAEDVLLVLQAMARAQRSRFEGPVLAITGSNGKTTVKEWVVALLPESVGVHRSPMSHNSQLGVPLSVWSLDRHHDVSFIEAGISQPGEMTRLAQCIHPTEGVLTHLGEAHLGSFRNPAHLAEEKCTLFEGCSRVYMPEDLRDASSPHIRGAIVTWAFCDDPASSHATMLVELHANRMRIEWQGRSVDVGRPFASEASVRNACTAALVALHHGGRLEDLPQRIAQLKDLTGRLSTAHRPRGGMLIQDDCNHDFGSLEVAMKALANLAKGGRRVAVVGDVPQSGLHAVARANRMAALASFSAVDDLWLWVPSWDEDACQAVEKGLKGSPCAVRCFQALDDLERCALELGEAHVLVKTASHERLASVLQALAPVRHVTTLTLNASALVDNLRRLKRHVDAQGVIAVIKGLGYGTDPVVLGRLLEAQGIDWLAVAYADEGVTLREAGIQARILVLNPDPATFDTMHDHGLEPQLVSPKHVSMAVQWANAKGVDGWAVHLKLDTGMHRLGLAPKEDAIVEGLLKGSPLVLASVMTHLAAADDPSLDEATKGQLEAFLCRTTDRFHNVPRHALNSSGAMRLHALLTAEERSRFAPVLQHIRVGLAMHGLGPGADDLGLSPVLSLDTSVAKLVHVPPGEGSGYGFTDAVPHERTLAVLSVGYADGYPRSLGNGQGQVTWRGVKLPTVGRVCMDMITVDVTGLDVQPGDRVSLWGTAPSLDEVAAHASTIPYELLVRLGPRVQRVVQR